MVKYLPKKPLAASICMSLVIASGCASTGKSIGLGAGTGAVLGAGVGAIADPGPGGENRVRNILIGTAAGGVLGAGIGYALSEHVKNERHEAEADGKKEAEEAARAQASGSGPRLIPARTEVHLVPGEAHGSTYVPRHFEYRIIENAHWDTKQ